jgi:hypothetical protein
MTNLNECEAFELLLCQETTKAAELLKMALGLMKSIEKINNPLSFIIGFTAFDDGAYGVNITIFSGEDNEHKSLYSFYSLKRNKLIMREIIAAMKERDFDAFRIIED